MLWGNFWHVVTSVTAHYGAGSKIRQNRSANAIVINNGSNQRSPSMPITMGIQGIQGVLGSE